MKPCPERAPLPEALERPERGRVLLFAPHPDDDLIGAGLTAHWHALQGDPVRVVVAYDGALGGAPGQSLGRADLVALRAAEARAGGAVLGLDDYRFLGYPEGHLPGPGEFASAVAQVAGLLAEFRPDLVYGPWIGEHQIDHHVLCRVLRAALARVGFKGQAWGYEVWTPLVPTRVIDVSACFELKRRGLEKHQSQMAHTQLVHHITGLNAHRALYLPKGARYGEAFAPLGQSSADDLALLPG
jgi:LmbE family N-acetylglucosaminyl deacetylase